MKTYPYLLSRGDFRVWPVENVSIPLWRGVPRSGGVC